MGHYRVDIEKTPGPKKDQSRLNVQVRQVTFQQSRDDPCNNADEKLINNGPVETVVDGEKVIPITEHADKNTVKDAETGLTQEVGVIPAGEIPGQDFKASTTENAEHLDAEGVTNKITSDATERTTSGIECGNTGLLQFDLIVAPPIKVQVNAMFRIAVQNDDSKSESPADQETVHKLTARSVNLNFKDLPEFEKRTIVVDTDENKIFESTEGSSLSESVTTDENKNDGKSSASEASAQPLTTGGYVMKLRVTDQITIDIEMGTYEEQTESTVQTASNAKTDVSNVEQILPYKGVFAEASKQYLLIPFGNLPPKSEGVDEARKKFLQDTMIHRFEMLGTPRPEAIAIVNRWSTSLVQHRPLSYRVPVKSRNLTSAQALDSLAGTSASASRLSTLIYHIEVLAGTLNSATATLLELELFLMLPHFRTKAAHDYGPHNRHGGILSTFIQDWISILRVAIVQLKPSDEYHGVHELVRKEIKAIGEAIDKTKKNCKKLKASIDEMEGQVDRFRKKLYNRLEVNKESAMDIVRKLEPHAYPGPSHRNIASVLEEDIFENHLYMQTGIFGLYMKRDLKEYWFPFSDLNFLERRVVFLGIADHMSSTFNAVQTTARHMQELFTPGYPMSFVRRVGELFKFMADDKKEYQWLSMKGKLDLYTVTCTMHAALNRLKFVTNELIKFSSDGKTALAATKFHVNRKEAEKILDELRDIRTYRKLNMVVPFATLKMDGFSTLTERGEDLTPFLMKPEPGYHNHK